MLSHVKTHAKREGKPGRTASLALSKANSHMNVSNVAPSMAGP